MSSLKILRIFRNCSERVGGRINSIIGDYDD